MTSDVSFPFGGPEPEAPADTVEEGGSRRTLVLGTLVGAVVLGAGGFFLLGGGGDAAEPVAKPVGKRPAAAAEVAAPAPIEVLPVASSEQLGRNPFKPRYVEPEPPAPAPDPVPSAQPSAAPTALPLPQQPVQVVVQQPTEEPAPAEYPITFVSTSEQGGVKTYTWRVDGAKETLTVLQGQRFGKYGELVVLMTVTGETGQPEAVLQVGDSSPVKVKLEETIKVL